MAAPTPIPILLVDDQPSNLIALDAVLKRPEYELVTAASGEEALLHAAERDFAVILIDVKMPGIDGYETVRMIRARERSRVVPIIFVTAFATDVREIYRAYSVGAVDYLLKPLDPGLVRAKVGVFVDLFRAREEIRQRDEIIRKSERAESLQREQAARIRAEAAEQRYHDLINWVDHAVLWEFDTASMAFRFVSARSAAILGFSPESWIRDQGFFLSRVPASDRTIVEQMLARAIRGGTDARCEHRFLKANGEMIWVHTGVNARRDRDGKVNLLWGLTVDITPLKRGEENQRFLARASAILAESLDSTKTLEALASLLVPQMADLCTIDMLNSDRSITRKVLAVGRVEKRKSIASLLERKRFLADNRSPIMRVIESGEPELIREVSDDFLRSIAGDDERLSVVRELGIVSAMIVPLRSHKGLIGSMSLASFDPGRVFNDGDLDFALELAWHAALAFENSRLYDAVQSAAQMRENVIGVVSHDLKTPLSAIRLALQMIVLHRDKDPVPLAERSIDAVDRMDRMIRDLLDLARIEAGQSPLEISEQDAGKLLTEVVETMQPIAARNSVAILQSVPAEPIPLSGDHDRIHRVLANVIGNAIKFSRTGTNVRVGVNAGGEAAEFWVADSGKGMAQDELAHVFEPYWRAEGSGKTEGTGLGLFISEKIVAAHGGRIWVESQLGQGTTVHFTIPRGESSSARRSA